MFDEFTKLGLYSSVSIIGLASWGSIGVEWSINTIYYRALFSGLSARIVEWNGLCAGVFPHWLLIRMMAYTCPLQCFVYCYMNIDICSHTVLVVAMPCHLLPLHVIRVPYASRFVYMWASILDVWHTQCNTLLHLPCGASTYFMPNLVFCVT